MASLTGTEDYSPVDPEKPLDAEMEPSIPTAETAEAEDPANKTLSELARQAVEEIDRLAAAGALEHTPVKQSIWTLLSLLRDFHQEHTNKVKQHHSEVAPLPTSRPLSPKKNDYVRWNKSLQNNDLLTILMNSFRKELQSLGPTPSVVQIRSVLTGTIHSFDKFLETRKESMDALNYAQILYRLAIGVAETRQQRWLVQEHSEFLKKLLGQLKSSLEQCDIRTLSSVISSLGKIGPALRTLAVHSQSYDYFFQDLLERTSQSFSTMTVSETFNILIGLTNSGVTPLVLRPFLRSFSKVLTMQAEDLEPGSLKRILQCYGQMRFHQDEFLFHRVCQVSEKKLETFSAAELIVLLQSLTSIPYLPYASFRKKVLDETKRRMGELSVEELTRMVRGLVGLLIYPGKEILDRMCERFEAAGDLSEFRPAQYSLILTILSRLGHQRDHSIVLCKRHFIKHPESYSIPVVSRRIIDLTLLEELDEPIMEALEKTSFAKLPLDYYNFEQRLALCKLLIYRRVVQKKDRPNFVSPELEESCYAAWRSTMKNQTSYGLVQSVLSILAEAGFDCKTAWILDKVPLSITSATLPASESGFAEDLNLVIDVVSKQQTFFNDDSILPEQCRLRKTLLEALNWKVIHIRSTEWNVLKDEKSKAQYLAELIKQKTGHQIIHLEDYKHGLRSETKSTAASIADPMKPEEESQMHENKIHIDSDLMISDQEDGRFHNIVTAFSNEDSHQTEEINTEENNEVVESSASEFTYEENSTVENDDEISDSTEQLSSESSESEEESPELGKEAESGDELGSEIEFEDGVEFSEIVGMENEDRTSNTETRSSY